VVTYEFQCEKCQKLYTVEQEMHAEHKYTCPECKGKCHQVYSAQMGTVDWVNGGWHGDEINMGLGKHFKSARERDNFAAANNLGKA